MLITGRTAPASLKVEIRDLASRLRALPVVTLDPPDDELLRALIVKLAADRQIAVDQGAGELPRHTASSAPLPPPARR